MSGIQTTDKTNILFKKFQGYANTDNAVNTEFQENARPFVTANRIFSQDIPSTAPALNTATNTTVPYIRYTGDTQVNITYQKEVATSFSYIVKYTGVQLFGFSGQVNRAFYYRDQNGNPNLLQQAIPSNYDSAGSYGITVTTNAGVTILPTEYSFDYDAGLITFYNYTGVTQALPPKVTFWRYEGAIGIVDKASTRVAIGQNAGSNNQAVGAVAIGNTAGQLSQGQDVVAIGSFAGSNFQRSGAIAIGFGAGRTSQQSNSISVGKDAASISQGSQSVAIGNSAGSNRQGIFSVAIGDNAGQTSQGNFSVAVGDNAGQISQQSNTIAIGLNAGSNAQGTNSIAIGQNAGLTSQSSNSIVLNASSTVTINGTSQGFYVNPVRNASNELSVLSSGIPLYYTTANEIVRGPNWSQVTATTNVNMGNIYKITNLAAPTANTDAATKQYVDNNTVSFDTASTIKIGSNAGSVTQGLEAVAIGRDAGSNTQGSNAITIGRNAGQTSQVISSIAIGADAGRISQGRKINLLSTDEGSAIAIGFKAGSNSQAAVAIAIGRNAGMISQGSHTIAIGDGAGYTSQANNSIILNAQTLDNPLNASNSGFYVAPVRSNVSGSTYRGVYYDTSANELVWGDSVASGNVSSSTSIGGTAFITNAAIPEEVSGYTAFIGSGGYLNAGRMIIGNGTGWNYSISRRSNLTTTDLLTIKDTGDITTGAVLSTELTIKAPSSWPDSSLYIKNPTDSSIWRLIVGGDSSAGGVNAKEFVIYSYSDSTRRSFSIDICGNSMELVPGSSNPQIKVGLSGRAYDNTYYFPFNDKSTIKIGSNAGSNTQGNFSVAIGNEAGRNSQGSNAVAIGNMAGYNTQGKNAIAIGQNAGETSQASNSIILNADSTALNTSNSGFYVNPIRNLSSSNLTETELISYVSDTKEIVSTPAIMAYVGSNSNGYSGGLHFKAGGSNQGRIVTDSGNSGNLYIQASNNIILSTWQASSILASFNTSNTKIGVGAGFNAQSSDAIAIGNKAGSNSQGSNTIAIGLEAGSNSQGKWSVAVGFHAGKTSQQSAATAVGPSAGSISQGYRAVALGDTAGYNTQGSFAVAIGPLAGETSQAANSIVINAQENTALNTSNSGFYVAPVRALTTTTTSPLVYDTAAKEIGYSTTLLVPTGTIIAYSSINIPSGWLWCGGQAVKRQTDSNGIGYPELFNIIGTQYGSGDSSSTFNLPDYTNRIPRGVTSLNTAGLGVKLGSDVDLITPMHLPPHSHNIVMPSVGYSSGWNGNAEAFGNPYNSQNEGTINTFTGSNVYAYGSTTPLTQVAFNKLPAVLTTIYIIKT